MLGGLFFGMLLFTGCGESPDVPAMKEGLVRSGMPEDEADCFAEKLGDTVAGEAYNYMSALMGEGVDEKDAITKARRKYGAEFRSGVTEARKACAE